MPKIKIQNQDQYNQNFQNDQENQRVGYYQDNFQKYNQEQKFKHSFPQKPDFSNLREQNNYQKLDYTKDPTEQMVAQAHESLKLLKSKRPNSRQLNDDEQQNFFQQKQKQQNVGIDYLKPKKIQKQNSQTQNIQQFQQQQYIQQDSTLNQNDKNNYNKFIQQKVATAPEQKSRKNTINVDDRPAYVQNINSQIQNDKIYKEEEIQLFECNQGCGRKFVQETLGKHQKVCKKVFQQKRKEFDSQAHRIISNEQQQFLKENQKKKNIKNNVSNQKTPQWKMQSEAFRFILKQNGNQQLTVQEQHVMKQQMEQAQGLIQCDYCNRKFNQKAHERHQPFCKEKTEKANFQKNQGKKK